MKKVLALVLAVVLAFGMTTVAFAYTNKYTLNVDTSAYYLTDDGKVDVSKPLSPDTDVVPGKTIYFQVTAAKNVKDSGKNAADEGIPYWETTNKLSDVSNYKISYSVDEGKNMIESVKMVSMKNTKYTSAQNSKDLYIAVAIKDNFVLESVDLDMDITITSKNSDAKILNTGKETVNNSYDKYTFNITPNAFYNVSGDPVEIDNGYANIEDDGSVLTFADDADDVTLMFGNDTDIEVWGNMKGQKDVFVRVDTSNAAVEDKYPDATIRFFSGDRDTFRRAVTVTMPYESSVENPYLYVVDAKGNLTKLYGGSNADKAATENDVEYDDVTGAFVFKTTTLNNYVLSDTELKGNINDNTNTDADAPAEGDKPTDGAQPNPGTGANDFVGLAVALAVVSVAGIAVAKRK